MVKIAATEIGDFGLGTAKFVFRPEFTREAAIQVVHAALANGVRLIDTARAYTRPGVDAYGETIVRDALAGLAVASQVLV